MTNPLTETQPTAGRPPEAAPSMRLRPYRCQVCTATWSGLRTEHCKACHQTFAGTRAGDMHRVGDHTITEGPARRRCLTPQEMEARGMRLDRALGVWRSGRPYGGRTV